MRSVQKKPLQHSMAVFSFEDFRIVSLNFSNNKAYKPSGEGKVIPDLSITYSYFEEENILKVLLKVVQHSKDVPYLFEVEGGGLFKFKENPPKEILESFSMVNCAAIIFPYIRETIADLTRRAGFQPLHLQPVNFSRLYADTNKKKQKKVSGQ